MFKRILLIALAGALCAFATACTNGKALPSEASAQSQEISQAAEEPSNLSGAYSKQRSITTEESDLFSAVIKDLKTEKTYELVSVATQVVAGTNYKFLAKATEGDTVTDVYIVIYQPLPSSGEATKFVRETPVE